MSEINATLALIRRPPAISAEQSVTQSNNHSHSLTPTIRRWYGRLGFCFEQRQRHIVLHYVTMTARNKQLLKVKDDQSSHALTSLTFSSSSECSLSSLTLSLELSSELRGVQLEAGDWSRPNTPCWQHDNTTSTHTRRSKLVIIAVDVGPDLLKPCERRPNIKILTC